MEKTMEGAHTMFLRKITGKQARWIPGGTWVTLVVEEVLEAVGTQLEATY